MKKSFAILIMLVLTGSAFAQQTPSKFELKLGLGTSFLGTGDMQTLLLENELNYALNRYFTASASINLARSNRGSYQTTSYTQGNINLFISPFTNTGKHDLRIGAGVSYYQVSDTWQSRVVIENGEVVLLEYGFEERNALGLSGILEYSFALSEKLSLGTKLFMQVFRNEDMNTGALVKLGVTL